MQSGSGESVLTPERALRQEPLRGEVTAGKAWPASPPGQSSPPVRVCQGLDARRRGLSSLAPAARAAVLGLLPVRRGSPGARAGRG
jgi:hypothetical protein